MARVFPSLPKDLERSLRAIEMVAKGDPDYFKDPACPYPAELREFLAQMLAPKGPTERVPLFTNTDADSDVILGEVQETIEEMKAIEDSIKTAESGEKIAFYKAKTQMMERWVNLKEKTLNLRYMSEFQKLVIATMEEVLDKDQQQDFKNRLKGLPQ